MGFKFEKFLVKDEQRKVDIMFIKNLKIITLAKNMKKIFFLLFLLFSVNTFAAIFPNYCVQSGGNENCVEASYSDWIGHSHLLGEAHHDCPHLHVYKNGISVGIVQYKR